MTMQHNRQTDMDVQDVEAKPRGWPLWQQTLRAWVSRIKEMSAPTIHPAVQNIAAQHDVAVPVRSRWSLRVMVSGMLLLLLWSAVGKIDQVTRAQAQIIAADRTQLVQSPDGGADTVAREGGRCGEGWPTAGHLAKGTCGSCGV